MSNFLPNPYLTLERDQLIFLGLQIAGGNILLPILLLTMILSLEVSRHPVLIAFIMSWIFSSIVYSIELYQGGYIFRQFVQPEGAAIKECLTQASLINGAQALTLSLTLALVIHLFVLLKPLSRGETDRKIWSLSRKRSLVHIFVLIGIPLATSIFLSIYTFKVASLSSEPEEPTVVLGRFYCTIAQSKNAISFDDPFRLVRDMYIFSNVLSISTVCLEMFIVTLVYRRRHFLEKVLVSETGNWKLLFLRVILFSLYRTVTLGLKIATILHPALSVKLVFTENPLYSGVVDLLEAALPLVVFLIFGTEKDIFRAWKFWKKVPKSGKSSVETSISSSDA